MSYFYFLVHNVRILLVFSLLLLLFSCNVYRLSFSGVNLPGRVVEHLPHQAPKLRKCRHHLLCVLMACFRVKFIFIYYFYIFRIVYPVYKNEHLALQSSCFIRDVVSCDVISYSLVCRC